MTPNETKVQEEVKAPTMELDFTPRTVKELEDLAKKPFVDIISDYSMGNIVLLVRKGAKVEEEGAYNKIEKFFAEGGDMMSLYLIMLEKLKERGFLPKVLDLEEMKKKLQGKQGGEV